MRVEWAVISRYAESTGGLATLVGAGIDTYHVAELPTELVVPLTIQLKAHQAEMTGAHEVRIRILDDSMEQLGEDATLSFEGELNPGLPEGWEAGALFTVLNRVTVERDGPYTISIEVDGQHSGAVGFRVVETE